MILLICILSAGKLIIGGKQKKKKKKQKKKKKKQKKKKKKHNKKNNNSSLNIFEIIPPRPKKVSFDKTIIDNNTKTESHTKFTIKNIDIYLKERAIKKINMDLISAYITNEHPQDIDEYIKIKKLKKQAYDKKMDDLEKRLNSIILNIAISYGFHLKAKGDYSAFDRNYYEELIKEYFSTFI